MAPTGIVRIDTLFAGGGQPLATGDTDSDAVGVVQDLLRGHGFNSLPGLLGTARGRFGSQTQQSVVTFQGTAQLPQTGAVDPATLQALAERPASDPRASRPYLAMVLDVLFAGMPRLMSITSEFEGAGRFAAFNANTDRAGLSFGLIQWAQRPGRLHDLLAAWSSGQRDAFVRVVAGGDAALADGLLAHTAKASGGVSSSGETIDPRFDLVRDPWRSRFVAAAGDRGLQRVQVDTAVAAFDHSLGTIQAFAGDSLKSERGIAFTLDLANQHGDSGARSIWQKVHTAGMSEPDLLKAMEDESVARLKAQFGDDSNEARSTATRRDAFRTSSVLSDAPFTGG